MTRSILISVNEPAHVGQARRRGLALAESLSFAPAKLGKVELAVTEAATNLLKHAGGGKVILRAIGEGAFEMLAVDKGPGMDISKCLRDGYSTAGSAGTGLGAISRQAQVFEGYSQPGQGTVLLGQFYSKPSNKPAGQLVIGAICVPSVEGDACGDDWSSVQNGSRSHLFVADGLGHGILAAEAAERAVEAFLKERGLPPAARVEAMHGPLRSTRGASLAVAELDHGQSMIRYAGVGNIVGTIVTHEGTRSMVSHNGTVGHMMPRVQEFQYPWGPEATVVLHSDGLMSRWKLDGYPGLLARHPSIIAAVLHRDFQRGRDDVTVVVARLQSRTAGAEK